MQGRIGADFALAQACIAALVLGQPFVAAEVVFIALVGEVLEAWTSSPARKRAMRSLVDQTPRTARVRRDGRGEIAAGDVAVGEIGDRPAGRADSGRWSRYRGPLDGRSIGADRRIDPDG